MNMEQSGAHRSLGVSTHVIRPKTGVFLAYGRVPTPILGLGGAYAPLRPRDLGRLRTPRRYRRFPPHRKSSTCSFCRAAHVERYVLVERWSIHHPTSFLRKPEEVLPCCICHVHAVHALQAAPPLTEMAPEEEEVEESCASWRVNEEFRAVLEMQL